jgi:hypothetical protein
LLERIYGSAIALRVIVDNDSVSSTKKGVSAIEANNNTWLLGQPEEEVKNDKVPETSSRNDHASACLRQ